MHQTDLVGSRAVPIHQLMGPGAGLVMRVELVDADLAEECSPAARLPVLGVSAQEVVEG